MPGARIGYRVATGLSGPLLRAWLRVRAVRGKEDPARPGQRRGRADRPRPPGPLLWLHGASAGESLSLLPLLPAVQARAPTLAVLATSGTRAGLALLDARAPDGVIVQAAPLDHPRWVARFLDHWRPDIALFAESELWPNLLGQAQARGTVTGLVNARLSERSARRWRRVPDLVRPLLGGLDLCLAQDTTQAERLAALGARRVRAVGSLKRAGSPLPADTAALAMLQAEIGDRPRWLAASTHAGEEAAAIDAHRYLARRWPDLVTLIVPRHPARGPELAAQLARDGLRVARRSAGARQGPETEVYLADTLGELGLFYRLAEVAFLGGTLASRGGHNPLEPARLDCALVAGPDLRHSAEIAAELDAAGALTRIRSAAELGPALATLLANPAARADQADRAAAVAARDDGTLKAVLDALVPYLDAATERAA